MTPREFHHQCVEGAWSQYVGDSVLCRILGDKFLYAMPTDVSLTPCLVHGGCWEPEISAAISRHLAPGVKCADIGANVGYFAVLMAKCVGQDNVIAVEPNPQLAKLARRTLQANGWFRTPVVEALVVASPAEPGTTARLVVPGDALGGASMRYSASPSDTVYDCRTATIDELCPGRLDVIKIDVESEEVNAWRGMAATLASNPQLRTFMEYTPRNQHEADQAWFFGDLRERNIPLRMLDPCGDAVDVTEDALASMSDWVMLELAAK